MTSTSSPLAAVQNTSSHIIAAQPNGLSLYGDKRDNTFFGSQLNDTISGEGGNDTLVGKGGDDIIMGGPGSDVIEAGDGNDEIHDLINLSSKETFHIGGGAGYDKLYLQTQERAGLNYSAVQNPFHQNEYTLYRVNAQGKPYGDALGSFGDIEELYVDKKPVRLP